jgi:uncharacterized membrane-anchored protein
MKQMRQLTDSSLSLLMGLLSSAAAACSGAGQDGLVTVGIRPSVVVVASGDATARGNGVLPVSGSDVMSQSPDGTSTTMRGIAGTGATAGSSATGVPGAERPSAAGAGESSLLALADRWGRKLLKIHKAQPKMSAA